jgi:hypothetical protein
VPDTWAPVGTTAARKCADLRRTAVVCRRSADHRCEMFTEATSRTRHILWHLEEVSQVGHEHRHDRSNGYPAVSHPGRDQGVLGDC